jgi:hypothetical protein
MTKCEYCKKTFARESSIITHVCQQKKRYLCKDNRIEKLAFTLFCNWNKIAIGSTKNMLINGFISSRYYNAFVSFAQYIIDVKVINPEEFLLWLIINKVKIDNWAKDSTYSKYLIEYSQRETPERAAERFVRHAEKWAASNNAQWHEYFTSASPNLIVHDITMGKISPWILLGVDQAKETLLDLPEELLDQVASTFDLVFWNRRVSNDRAGAEWLNGVFA